MTAASIAPLVRSALDRANLAELGALLSPDVQWGAPDDPSPSCRTGAKSCDRSSRDGPRAAGPR